MSDTPVTVGEALRAVQNCLLVVPEGKFKQEMEEWLDRAIRSTLAPAFEALLTGKVPTDGPTDADSMGTAEHEGTRENKRG